MALAEVSRGISLASVATELDRSSASISRWKKGLYKAPKSIRGALAKRGRFLSAVSLERYDFDWVCSEFSVKQSFIADTLGITRQALENGKLRGFTPERRREIERILHRLGRELLTLSKHEDLC